MGEYFVFPGPVWRYGVLDVEHEELRIKEMASSVETVERV